LAKALALDRLFGTAVAPRNPVRPTAGAIWCTTENEAFAEALAGEID